MQALVQLPVTPAVRAVQVLMVTRVILAMQAVAQLTAVQVLRVMLGLMVTLVQQAQRAPEQIRVQQALRVMPVLQVMLVRRVTQVLALHRAMLDRLTLAGQETPDRRPRLTAQTPQRFGHSSRFRSRLVVEARQAKSPLLGDGLR